MTFSDVIRDAPVGQIIRLLTKNRLLQYPEERSDFVLPEAYVRLATLNEKPHVDGDESASPPLNSETSSHHDELDRVETHPDDEIHEKADDDEAEPVGARLALEQSKTQEDLERQYTAAASFRQAPSRPIAPSRLDDGTILVDWYTTDDDANPQNWSSGRKIAAAMQIYFYTTAVYMGSAIYAPSEPGVMEEFGVSAQVAALGLSMYVLAYGLGPMLWSPLSEVPAIGRNPPYLLTFAIFVILLVPTALVENMPGLAVLRFLLGFFGSPCLATGGASMADMYSIIKLPYVISGWALAATCGPALGPIISGFSVTAEGWRWSQWEMLWMAGPAWIVMFLFLPETSSPNILYRRAQRLRKLTGNSNLRAQSEIDSSGLSIRNIAIESLWRPTQMNLLDPAVAFTSFYTALVYGIFYSFFEAFPEVYGLIYHFNMGEQGLAFLSVTAGVFIALAIYWIYIYFIVEPDMLKNGLGKPERRLIPALWTSFLAPIGLFLFAWTSREEIHWIASIIGVAIFTVSIFIVMQCVFIYLPLTYPQYAASLFAGNDVTRSTLAAAAIHFSRPLFAGLGVDGGVSLLAGLTVGCVFGIFALWYWGEWLRSRSRFTVK